MTHIFLKKSLFHIRRRASQMKVIMKQLNVFIVLLLMRLVAFASFLLS